MKIINSVMNVIKKVGVIAGYYGRHYRIGFYRKWERKAFEARATSEKQIPKFQLEHKHIANARLLLGREELLNLLPKNAVCAEIGVDKGEFSELILKITNPAKLHLIDSWDEEIRYHSGLKITVQDKFKEEIKNGIVEVNEGLSTSVLTSFDDYYFDWVYLDTAHTYQVTAEELKLLLTKVKPNGIIAGHDYTLGNWVGGMRYGVIEAVHEFCVKHNWEILYLTSKTHQFKSFAIRRIAAK